MFGFSWGAKPSFPRFVIEARDGAVETTLELPDFTRYDPAKYDRAVHHVAQVVEGLAADEWLAEMTDGAIARCGNEGFARAVYERLGEFLSEPRPAMSEGPVVRPTQVLSRGE